MKALRTFLMLLFALTAVIRSGADLAASIPITGATSFPIGFAGVQKPAAELTLDDFINSVEDGNSASIRGIYVGDDFALRVIQQPSNQPGFVSTIEGVVTQFMDADRNGTIGLLAHNFLSGRLFFQLKIGDKIQLVRGDGTLEKYQVTETHQYQALQPENPRSAFVELTTGFKYSAASLFIKMYTGKKHLTLQTCIEKGKELSWGRLFVIASPVT
jgi:hypothetical protein